MIERQITFTVHPEHATAFERYFAERYRPAMAAAPGFVRVALLREAEDPGRYQMALGFTDGEGAVAWRTSPAHEALQPELKSLAAIERIVQFDVVG